MKKKELHMVFQLNKTILFEVHYYTVGSNKSADFSTEAELFVRNKKDFERCGQCQRDLLVNYPEAMAFFEKWNVHHLKDLSDEAYSELATDLAVLSAKYNYMLKEHFNGKTVVGGFTFNSLAEFSKMKPKSDFKTAKAQLRNEEQFTRALHYVNRPVVPFFNN